MLRGITIGAKRSRLWSDRERWRGWPAVFLGLCLVPLLVLALPAWSFEGKALAILHGICSQRPTHSFYFGDSRLPFAARMTGIYGGFAVSCLVLLARGRWRAGGVPRAGILIVMAVFVLAMGIDGINSTLMDIGVWHVYEPQNELRIMTGLLTGISLAIFVWLLVGQVAFAPVARGRAPVVRDYWDLALMVLAGLAYGLVVLTTWPPLRIPISILLIGAAVTALTGLMLAFVILIRRREQEATDTWALAGPASLALLLAFGLLAGTSAFRFVLEALLNISTNTPT